MFLYWAVLSLLLLLPPSINSESDVGNYRGSQTEPDPKEKSCGEGICTNIQYNPRFCNQNTQFIDTRLYLTAAMVLEVDDSGLIKKRYLNALTAEWFRYWRNIDPLLGGFIFDLKFVGKIEAAKIEEAKLTDVILYMGSDHAVNYDPPIYAYNSSLLQLKKGSILSDPYKHGPIQICSIFIQTRSNLPVVDNGGSQSNWISEPGIYRINLATGRMNELNYDPSGPAVTHLT